MDSLMHPLYSLVEPHVRIGWEGGLVNRRGGLDNRKRGFIRTEFHLVARRNTDRTVPAS
jgi:hypothetical protein